MLNSVIEKISYYQELLRELQYPILNPISYYKDDKDYRTNFKNDEMNYKNYEKMLDKFIDNLNDICDSEKIEIFYSKEKTVYLRIRYIDIDKQKKSMIDLSDELTKQFREFKI